MLILFLMSYEIVFMDLHAINNVCVQICFNYLAFINLDILKQLLERIESLGRKYLRVLLNLLLFIPFQSRVDSGLY